MRDISVLRGVLGVWGWYMVFIGIWKWLKSLGNIPYFLKVQELGLLDNSPLHTPVSYFLLVCTKPFFIPILTIYACLWLPCCLYFFPLSPPLSFRIFFFAHILFTGLA